MEEENLVKEFFNALLQIMKPFTKTIQISISSLPERYREQIAKAHLRIDGQLVLVLKDGDLQILDLQEKENRQLLVEITGEIMARLEAIIEAYKSRIENRIKFLLPITQELQQVAKVFSET